MALVRKIHNRGADIVVEANAEVLFAPNTSVGRFEAQLRERVAAAVVGFAPTNRRPRWAHYGKPLKQTIKRTASYHPSRMKIYSAVGSTAPYAAYVDQGTGIYGGHGSYPAKILPPSWRGATNLYEHTWIPPGSNRRVGPVTIKGQRGQKFFQRGLDRGFNSMRLRGGQVKGETLGKIGPTMQSLPPSMLNVFGNTPWSFAFDVQLRQWRLWRDEAWRMNRDLRAGVGTSPALRARAAASRANTAAKRASRKAEYKRREAERSRRNRAKAKAAGRVIKRTRTPAKPDPTKKPKRGWPSVAAKKSAALAQFERQNPGLKIIKSTTMGVVVQPPKGSRNPVLIPWSRMYRLID